MKHQTIYLSDKELELEQWLPIPSFEGLYEASSLGRIRTTKNKVTINKNGLKRVWKQRILKYKTNNGNEYKTGYRVTLWKNGKDIDYLVARLVASAFIKNELNNKNLTINHINGNRLDNRIENLEWCTLAENIRKGFEEGLYPMKKIKVINKETNETIVYRSLKTASESINKYKGYLSEVLKKGKNEDKNYKWELV